MYTCAFACARLSMCLYACVCVRARPIYLQRLEAMHSFKANCLAGPVPVLVTQLGPDRSSERKAALITAATGKTPHFVSNLLDKVRSGIFQPGRTALEYAPLTPEYPIGKALGDMEQMRVVIKDLRRAELVAVENRNRVRAGARAESHEPSLAEDPTTRVGRG